MTRSLTWLSVCASSVEQSRVFGFTPGFKQGSTSPPSAVAVGVPSFTSVWFYSISSTSSTSPVFPLCPLPRCRCRAGVSREAVLHLCLYLRVIRWPLVHWLPMGPAPTCPVIRSHVPSAIVGTVASTTWPGIIGLVSFSYVGEPELVSLTHPPCTQIHRSVHSIVQLATNNLPVCAYMPPKHR